MVITVLISWIKGVLFLAPTGAQGAGAMMSCWREHERAFKKRRLERRLEIGLKELKTK